MTQEEIDIAVGRALREVREAKRRLACLKARATDMRRAMLTMEWCLDGTRKVSGIADGKIAILHPGTSTVDEYVEWPTAESIVSLLEEIEETAKEIDRLKLIVEG